MILKHIKDYFKSEYGWVDSISIGKIDTDQEKALCFYNSRLGAAKIGAIGGKENNSYAIKPITILLRWTTNADTAEQKAQTIYDFFNERQFTLNGKRVFIISRYDSPIDLGTDERGVYEYSFEFNVYETN